MPTYKAAVIGLGRMGSTFDDEVTQSASVFLPYCHAPSYAASDKTELVAGADPHREQRAIFGERWGISSDHLYRDYQEMLEKEALDIVSICTTARVRHQIVVDVAGSGVKAIWAEKPIALSLAEADEMLRACDARNVVLAVNCARRYNPYFAEMKRMINEGILGDLLQVTAYAHCGISHNGSHALDALRFLAGSDVKWVFGEMESDEAAASDNDLMGNGYLSFDSGVTGFFRGLPGGVAEWEFDAIGTKGRVRSLANCQEVEWLHLKDTETRKRGLPARSTILLPARIQGMGLSIIDDLVECTQSGRRPRCSGHDARAALETAIALRESHRQGGVRVELPIRDRTLRILSGEIREDNVPARIRRMRLAKQRQ